MWTLSFGPFFLRTPGVPVFPSGPLPAYTAANKAEAIKYPEERVLTYASNGAPSNSISRDQFC